MIFVLVYLAVCIATKEASSLIHKIKGSFATDHQNDNYKNETQLISMLQEFAYLNSFFCEADRMKKRYDSKWFVDHQTTIQDVQPFYFVHIVKSGGLTVVKELEVLWKDKYWCQFQRHYIPIINDKSIFPYKKPLLITFLRQPLDQVVSLYRQFYDLAVSNGSSGEDKMWGRRKLMGDINHCFHDKQCTNRHVSAQSRTLGGMFDPQKFWFVGITEMMYSSLCLLMYKMGVYNMNRCDCSNRNSSKIPHEDHHSSHAFNSSSISKTTKEVILSHSKQDIQIYDASFQFFMEELNSTGTQSGIDFNCGSMVKCVTC